MIFVLSILFACHSEERFLQVAVRCTGMLEELLDIQQTRDGLMDDMQAKSKAHKQGLSNKEEHFSHYVIWKEQESHLRGQADFLFQTAEENGCL